MAIIYSYPTVIPTTDDLILGTDVNKAGNPTKNFTIGSVIDLVTAGAAGLGATIKLTDPLGDAKDPVSFADQPMINLSSVTGSGALTFPSLIAGDLTIAGGNLTTTGNLIAGTVTATSLTGNLLSTGTAGQIASAVQAITQAANDNSNKIATTAYVDGIVDPSVLTFLGTTGGDQTVNLVAQKLSLLGTADQIESVSAGQAITFSFPAAGVTLPDGSKATTQAANNSSTLVATTAFVQQEITGQDLDFSGDAASAGQVDLDSQVFAITGTANQTSTAALNQGLSISLTPSVTISGTYTGATFVGDLNGTVNTLTTGITQAANNNSTKIATTEYVDRAGGAKTLSYKDTSATVNTMNLATDDIQFTGGSNITSTATAVALTIADIKFDLDNSIALTGEVKANNFTTTAGTATWVTTVLNGFTSITSDLFAGPLTGEATSAAELATPGTMSIDGDFTTTVAPTYTAGGNKTITANMPSSVAMAKTLVGYTAGTAGAIASTDTVLDAFKKLQASITATTGLSYEGAWTPGTDATAGGTPDLRLVGAKVNGAFYICDADGTGTPNGDGSTPNSWKSGDWVIYVANGSATDEWQKLDQSNEVLGSGTPNQYTMWSGTNTIGTGVISQDTAATKTVTIGSSANLTVQGNTTLGDGTTDTVTAKGNVTFDTNLNIKQGISVDGTAGTDGYVLTSGNGIGAVMRWEQPKVGTVTSVSATTAGDALDVAVTNPTTTPAIALTWAGGATGATKYVNGLGNLITFPTLDNYQYWTLSDGTNTTNITTTGTAKFVAGDGIINTQGSGILTTQLRYDDSDNAGTLKNFVEAATTGTPTADDLLLFGDQAGGSAISKVKKATISSIVDLGNETLTEVLANGNNSGGAKNINMTGTISNITLVDSGTAAVPVTTQGRIQLGAGADLQIYHDGSNSYIKDAGTGRLILQTNYFEVDNAAGSEAMIEAIEDGAVNLYYNGSKKFETTDTGISVTGGGAFTGDITAAVGTFKAPGAAASIINAFQAADGNNAATFRTTTTGYVFEIRSQNSGTIKIDTSLATFTGNVKIDGNLTVDGSIIHGGGGTTKGGTFTGSAALTDGVQGNLFTLTRANTGTLMFDVWLTSGDNTTESICKRFTVARSYGVVSPPFNKLIDTGPVSSNDFAVSFVGDSTTGVICKVTPNGTNQTISYTVMVGFDSVNTLTVS